MDREYKGTIWTNHALKRLSQRGIKQGDAWATWRRPQESRRGESAGSWVYYRTIGGQRIEVVAKKNEKREWLILSVWSKPALGNKTSSSLAAKITRFIDFLIG